MLSLTIQKLGDVTVYRCAGKLTAGQGDDLRRMVTSQPPLRLVVLDLAGISTVDAAGLGTLVLLLRWAQATGREFKLMNVVPRVEQLLQLTNLKSVFAFCSVREVLDLMCRAARQTQFAAAATQLVA
ncbi:MAG: STAS domain-containing protein [Terriglobales bacterium]|jgi:anti-anti-sigma factor